MMFPSHHTRCKALRFFCSGCLPQKCWKGGPSAIWLCRHKFQSTWGSAPFLSLLSPCQLSVLSHPSFAVVFSCFPLCPDGTIPSQCGQDLGSSGRQMFPAGRRSGDGWRSGGGWRSGDGLLTHQDHPSGLSALSSAVGRAAALPCVASALAKNSLCWPGA